MITETRMINLSAKKRLAIFLSCGWIILFVIYAIRRASDGFPWSAEFLGFGISPPFIIWGIHWVISGFKRDKSKSEPLSATAQNEKPKLPTQEEHEKPKFQNREEYEQWKAERIGNLGAKLDRDKYDESKYKDEDDDEIYYKSPLKSKSRWGWGWFILFLSYSSWFKKAGMEPNAISYILVPAVMFVSDFWLRTRMIGMFSKLWKVSFVAGIISLFLSGFLMAILM